MTPVLGFSETGFSFFWIKRGHPLKKLHIIPLVSLLFFILLPCSAFAETLTVRADNWLPYNGDPEGKRPGYMIEVLKEILEPNGIDVDYQLLSWDTALEDVTSGRYDAVVGTDQEEAPELIFPSKPFGKMTNAFYKRVDSVWQYNGIKSLENLRLGVISDYSYSDDLDAYIEQNEGAERLLVAEGDDALPKLIEMMEANRIDVIVENVNVMAYTLGKNQIANIIPAGKIDEEFLLYVAFSPKNERSTMFARLFDEGVDKLRKSGELAKIIARYGVSDWQ